MSRFSRGVHLRCEFQDYGTRKKFVLKGAWLL